MITEWFKTEIRQTLLFYLCGAEHNINNIVLPEKTTIIHPALVGSEKIFLPSLHIIAYLKLQNHEQSQNNPCKNQVNFVEPKMNWYETQNIESP